MWLLPLALVVGAYFVGGIPFGVLIARRKGIKIQEHGSGNIGATNVTRVLGIKTGLLVLVLDAAKGALPVYLAMDLVGDHLTVAKVGFAAILGHCYSPFLDGRGGKGVATALGVFLVIEPAYVGVAMIVFGVVLLLTKVPALGSLAGTLTITVLFMREYDPFLSLLAFATTMLLVYTHRTNLAKLITRFRA